MTAEKKPPSLTPTLIGLLGTVLAVAGGLCGALITAAVTVYQVNRESQKLELASSGGEQVLSIDTGSIFLDRAAAAALDPGSYYVDMELGFVLHRPLAGWGELQEMTLGEQLEEAGAKCLVVCDQPVFRIRFGEPVAVETDRLTTVNGLPVLDEFLDLSEQLYGPPPWKSDYYSQVILNIYSHDQLEPFFIDNLAEMTLFTTRYSGNRYNRMLAPAGSRFIMLQGSSALANLRIAGAPGEMTLDDWLLFAESDKAYYIVEIVFTTRSGQTVAVWDDLQTYINYFRVIE
jgi:hypothetical protein